MSAEGVHSSQKNGRGTEQITAVSRVEGGVGLGGLVAGFPLLPVVESLFR